jgi:hypothetical protein
MKKKTTSATASSTKKTALDEDREFSDMTAVPAGIELYAKLTNGGKPVSVSFRADCELVDDKLRFSGSYVFASNVPHGATDRDVSRALSYAAIPAHVYFLESHATKANRSRFIKVASKRNAIFQFANQDERDRVATTETKLFGVLCKSSGKPVDSERLMFLEPADSKTNLIITDVAPEMTVEDFQRRLPEFLDGSGLEVSSVTSEADNTEAIGSRYIVLKFPSFMETFAAVRHLQSNNSLKAALSNFRSCWQDGKDGQPGYAIDMPHATSYDP